MGIWTTYVIVVNVAFGLGMLWWPMLLIWHPEHHPIEHVNIYWVLVALYWMITLGRMTIADPVDLCASSRIPFQKILFFWFTFVSIAVVGLMAWNGSNYDWAACDFWVCDGVVVAGECAGEWSLRPFDEYRRFNDTQKAACAQEPTVPAFLLWLLDTSFTVLLGEVVTAPSPIV
eukprot:COSAG01_NODE_4681_length_4821_cov_3.217493_3_plen_174_part_00